MKVKHCIQCNKVFETKRRKQKFCSSKCHSLFMTKPDKECVYCHKLFHAYHGKKSNIYCSIKCFSLSNVGKEFTKERIEKMSIAASNRLHNNIKMGNFTNKTYTTMFGDIIHYQSKLEKLFIKFCELNKIRLEDAPKIKYSLNGIERIYTPDFQNDNFIIEIKGNHPWYKKDLKSGEIQSKIAAAKVYATKNNKKFLFILGKEKFATITEELSQ
jgi:hypothetical protein